VLSVVILGIAARRGAVPPIGRSPPILVLMRISPRWSAGYPENQLLPPTAVVEGGSLSNFDYSKGMGLIVRTAAPQRPTGDPPDCEVSVAAVDYIREHT